MVSQTYVPMSADAVTYQGFLVVHHIPQQGSVLPVSLLVLSVVHQEERQISDGTIRSLTRNLCAGFG